MVEVKSRSVTERKRKVHSFNEKQEKKGSFPSISTGKERGRERRRRNLPPLDRGLKKEDAGPSRRRTEKRRKR